MEMQYLGDDEVHRTSSSLELAFNSAPDADEEITGSMVLSFTVSGTGTAASILVEISEDNASFNRQEYHIITLDYIF